MHLKHLVIIFQRFFETFFAEFAGLDKSMLLKALETLEASKKAEVIMFGGSEGVKFFWNCKSHNL